MDVNFRWGVLFEVIQYQLTERNFFASRIYFGDGNLLIKTHLLALAFSFASVVLLVFVSFPPRPIYYIKLGADALTVTMCVKSCNKSSFYSTRSGQK